MLWLQMHDRLLLMYVEPLDEQATLVFMGNDLAYVATAHTQRPLTGLGARRRAPP